MTSSIVDDPDIALMVLDRINYPIGFAGRPRAVPITDLFLHTVDSCQGRHLDVRPSSVHRDPSSTSLNRRQTDEIELSSEAGKARKQSTSLGTGQVFRGPIDRGLLDDVVVRLVDDAI
jgi:hypothetical protein